MGAIILLLIIGFSVYGMIVVASWFPTISLIVFLVVWFLVGSGGKDKNHE